MTESIPPLGRTDLWLEERHQESSAMRFRVRKVLFSDKSKFQRVEIVETEGHGRMLLNDGLVMISERDEFVYHEMMVHVPLFTHPNPRRVLIIGGGDGGTAREVLRHPGVETCRMVEIDRMVVDACREHIPQTAAALDDPRLTLTIEDGVKFVAETDETFDVVLVDSTDPIGPAQPLFGSGFYESVHRVLGDSGIVVSQGESPFYDTAIQRSMLGILGNLFRNVQVYNFSNLTYPGGLWSFTWGSGGLDPVKDFDPERVEKAGLEFGYYNVWTHKAAFALPSFMMRDLGRLLRRS